MSALLVCIAVGVNSSHADTQSDETNRRTTTPQEEVNYKHIRERRVRKKDIDNLSIILGIAAPEETEGQKKRGSTENATKRISSKSSTSTKNATKSSTKLSSSKSTTRKSSTSTKKEQPARYRNVGARKRDDLTPTRGETYTAFKTAVNSQLWEDFKNLCTRNDITIRDGITAALSEYINKNNKNNTAKK